MTLSYSRVSTFERCPRMWHYLYVKGLTVPTDPNLEFGKDVHSAIQVYLSGERKDDLWGRKAKEYLDKFSIVDYQIEQEFLTDDFKGVLDVVGKDIQGDIHVVDWKTSRIEYTEHDVVTSAQLTAYAGLILKCFGKLPKLVHFGVFDKNSGFFAGYASSRTAEDVAEWGRRVEVVSGLMDRGYNVRNPLACHDFNKKCHFYSRCWPKDSVFIGGLELPMIGGI